MGVKVLGLFELVLAPGPLVQTRNRDRAGQLEAADLEPVGEIDRVDGALDIGDTHLLRVRLHVIDGSEVEEVTDLALQGLDLGLGYSEHGLAEVADDGHDLLALIAESRAHLLELPAGAFPDQDMYLAIAFQQLSDQVAADKTGTAGDEIIHLHLSVLSTLMGRIGLDPTASRRERICSTFRGVVAKGEGLLRLPSDGRYSNP